MNKDEIQSHNRAIIVLVLGIFATTWVMFNSNNLIMGAVAYIVIGVLGIFFYKFWEKIGIK